MEKKFSHMWAITAHGESPYLEESVKSIVNQTVKSKMKIFTATDNSMIRAVAQKYGIEVVVRTGEDTIRYNWNFAYNNSDADWVTIAHQDDLYRDDYVEQLKNMAENEEKATLFFSDYLPFGGNSKGTMRNRNIQRIIKFPLKYRLFSDKKLWKRFALAVGNGICCPTVSYHKSVLGDDIYMLGSCDIIKDNLDWELFAIIAKRKGRFLYYPKPLLNYRVHGGSLTKEYIGNHVRETEDMYMFRQFWPEWITRILMHFYRKSYEIY